MLAVAPVQAVAHDPDPIFGGGLYTQNKVLQYRWTSSGTPPLDMKGAIHAARDDSNASRKSKAPSFDYDSGAGNVIYYGTDVPCGTNGLACFRRDTPDWFGMWFRPNGYRFEWGTLRWCELSGARRLLRRREHRPRRVRPRPRPRPPRELRRRQRLQGRRRPDVLADQAEGRLQRARVRAVRRRRAPAGVRPVELHDAVQHLLRRPDRGHAERRTTRPSRRARW